MTRGGEVGGERGALPSRVAAAHRTAMLVVMLFAMSVGVMTATGLAVLGAGGKGTGAVPIPFYVAAIFLALGAIAVRRAQMRTLRLQAVAGLRGIEGLLRHFVNVTILSAALAELIGVLGLVAGFMNGEAWDVLRLNIVALAVILYNYPRRAAWQQAADYFAAGAPGAAVE